MRHVIGAASRDSLPRSRVSGSIDLAQCGSSARWDLRGGLPGNRRSYRDGKIHCAKHCRNWSAEFFGPTPSSSLLVERLWRDVMRLLLSCALETLAGR